MTDIPFPQPGRCYCGAVRFELTAMPFFSYLCHCSICRRRSGAAYGISTALPADAIRFTQGEPAVQPRADGSELLACGDCGSKIYTRREGRAYITFRPGLLDDSSWVTPVGQIWTQNALPWALLEGVISFEGNPDTVSGMAAAWERLGLVAAGPRAASLT